MKLRKTPIGYNLIIQEDELELCPIKEVYPLSNGYAIATYPKDEDIVCLSKQNCDEIFGVFDIEKMAEFSENSATSNGLNTFEYPYFKKGFNEGFNKHAELNKDKVFTLEDMKRACSLIFLALGDGGDITTDEVIQSLQKNEWEVEIVTEPMNLDEIREQGKGFLNSNTNKPKLDEKGKLILKRK